MASANESVKVHNSSLSCPSQETMFQFRLPLHVAHLCPDWAQTVVPAATKSLIAALTDSS